MANLVLIGCQWGDEGKGRIVDLLTRRADVVVRFQGGPNAGHTLVVDDRELVLHLIPSGILHRGVTCVIGNGVVVDPDILLGEIEFLREEGRAVEPGQLLISDRATVIMPYHRILDGLGERGRGSKKIGTTGRGIGPAYQDKVGRYGIRIGDLLDEDLLRTRLESLVPLLERKLDCEAGVPLIETDALVSTALGWGERLRPLVADTVGYLAERIADDDTIIFEGAQGTQLDIDHGTYPFVTSSNTTAGAACTGSGVGPTSIDAVVGIAKAYTTRVGEGPFPTEDTSTIGQQLRERGGEVGATTGRDRRCGWFDAVIVRRAAAINGLTGLALTKLDVLSGLASLRVATSYLRDGRPTNAPPWSAEALGACEPVYEELPGWDEDISGIRRFDDLPATARTYVERLEELVGVPVRMISVGPERQQIIERTDPFAR